MAITRTGPGSVVQPLPAAAPRFGLLATIPVTTDQGTQWTQGMSYHAEGCQEGESIDPCDIEFIETTSNPGSVLWDPYVLQVSEICSTFSGLEENQARVQRLLNADRERQLGLELWEGVLASGGSNNTWLADATDPAFADLSPSGNAGTGLVHGLACLEQYLASHNGGQQGIIHATAQVVTHWESFRLLRREGNKILTMKDTLVICSPGYSGNDPDGDIDTDSVWAYATDMIRIFLGEPNAYDLMKSIDRTRNTVEVVADQFALAEWQRCRHAGIRLAVTACGTGTY